VAISSLIQLSVFPLIINASSSDLDQKGTNPQMPQVNEEGESAQTKGEPKKEKPFS
jgi:hypothetical protein